MIRRYYEDELHYLHEAGKEFAAAHPEVARYLNIDSVSDRDPYVERLFEGFAFLTGRIRERLDDELPQITDGLFSFLWPHFLKPVPALSILEFKARPGLVQQTTAFPAGTEVRSVPVGDEAVQCRFRTTTAVRLQPFRLADAVLSWPPDGTTSLTLKFDLDKNVEYKNLRINPLRLYLHAEDTVASTVHLFATRHVSRVTFGTGDRSQPGVTLSGQHWVRPAGLDAAEGIVPYSLYSFPGYRLLQEYLSFRRKFWFIDVFGFDRFSPPEKTGSFIVRIDFQRAFPEEKKFKAENLRLFCAPVVNLFTTSAEPVRLTHRASEYRIVPDLHHPRSVEVYSVDAVSGVEEGSGKRQAYVPFYSYQHGVGSAHRFFTTSRPGPSDRMDTYLSAGGFATGETDLPAETLSLEVTCTNGSLPREKLQERTITQPAPEFSNVATFENLTQPTLPLHPPGRNSVSIMRPRENFMWKLISHLSHNFMSVATPDALRSLLELYDWSGTDANRRRIDGVRDVRWNPKEIVVRGAVLRGTAVTIEVQDGHFADEGDVCLFGLIMSEFFSAYATLNSFVHLTVITKPSEQTYRWEPLKGHRPLL